MANQDTAQYREFIGKLQREELRPAALNDIKNLLVYKPADEAVTTIRDVGISKILQCLNVSNKSHVDLTCEVLKICFEKFGTGDVVKNYTSHIMYLLRHEKNCVRQLAIDEIYKAVTTDAGLLPVPQFIDVYVAVAQMVGDQDVGVANKAILITSNLPLEAYPKVLDEMKIALEYNCSSKCNAYEVIVHISTKSSELCKLCADLNYIDHMVSEVQSNDVLYQLNILELLSRLVVSPHGILYLKKLGALNIVAEVIKDLKNNPLGGLLTPGYMKFFGSVAHHYPKEIFDKYPDMLNIMFDAFDSGEETLLTVALDTLGFIGTSIEGKLCLVAVGSKYTQCVDKVGQLIRNSKTDIKIRALHCLASLISIEKDPNTPKTNPVDHRVTLMTREWFRSLSVMPTSMDVLFGICKNPFNDISLAAFELLDSVCQHQWGEELVARVAGFIEYLLDRTQIQSKEVKEAKYDIIKRLCHSAAFDDNIIERLQTYVEQGPFYSETAMEVAIEEAD